MSCIIDLGQMLKIKVSVCLGGADTGVPQHFLHSPQIPTGLQHVRGKRVPQHMRVEAHAETLAFRLNFEALIDRSMTDVFSVPGKK